MGVKKSKPTTVVVGGTKKPFARRKVVGLSLLALIVLALVGVSAFAYMRQSDSQNDTEKPKTAAQTIDSSDSLKYSKNYDQAAAVAAKAYDDSESSEDKYRLALQAGAVYETNKDCTKAITWYSKAEEIKPDKRGALVGLARCYEANGNKEKAIAYYKKVVALKDSTGIGTQNDQAYYQYRLDKLTGDK